MRPQTFGMVHAVANTGPTSNSAFEYIKPMQFVQRFVHRVFALDIKAVVGPRTASNESEKQTRRQVLQVRSNLLRLIRAFLLSYTAALHVIVPGLCLLLFLMPKVPRLHCWPKSPSGNNFWYDCTGLVAVCPASAASHLAMANSSVKMTTNERCDCLDVVEQLVQDVLMLH